MALGIAPPVEDTPVGDVRLLVGDINYGVAEPGWGEYDYFSDAEIRTFLKMAKDSLKGAAAIAYGQMANTLILTAKNIATDDLRIATEKRAEMMLRVAESWKADAAAEVALAASDDFELLAFQPARDLYPF